MQTKQRPRPKSKTNPKHICFCCEEKIKNRDRNAQYCKECYKIRKELSQKIHKAIIKIKKEYPDYKIKTRLNLKITKNVPKQK